MSMRERWQRELFHSSFKWVKWHTNPFEWRQITELGWWAL